VRNQVTKALWYVYYYPWNVPSPRKGIVHIWWCACVPANVASPLLLVWCLVRGVLHTWCHGSNKQLRSLWHEVSLSWICNRLGLPFQACNDFQNNGTCVTQCPPAMIYDPDLFQIVPNPDYRLAAGDLCVEQCPSEQVCLHRFLTNLCVHCWWAQTVSGALERGSLFSV